MKRKLLILFLLGCITVQAQFWTEVAPFTDASNLKQISIVDDNVVWVSSSTFISPGVINDKWSHSTDGGSTWTSGVINLGNPNLVVGSICAISSTQAYVSAFQKISGVYGGVWFTQDGGTTWTKQPSASFNSEDSFVNFLHFWDSSKGVVVGDPIPNPNNPSANRQFEIYTTSDGGQNWNLVPANNLPPALDANEYALSGEFEVQGNNIRFGTTYGRIFSSTDFGATWAVNQTPIPDFGGGMNGSGRGSFSFKNETEGLLVNDELAAYKTINGGQTWTNMNSPAGIRNFNIQYVPATNNTYFCIGEDASGLGSYGSSYSTDGGDTWINLNNVDSDPVLPTLAKFKSGNNGFCFGYYTSEYFSSGNPTLRIFKLTDPLNRLNGNLSTKTNIESQYSVVPNPTSGIIRISGKNISEIALMDVQGKMLLNQKVSNVETTDLDLNSLQNGIYFAQISTEKGDSNTVKVVKK